MSPRPDVTIREFEPADADAVERWVDEGEVARELGLTADVDVAAWLTDVASDRDTAPRARWLLAVDLPDRPAVGAVLLSVDSRADRRAEVGFAVGRDHRGRGVAGAALTELARLAVDEGLHRLWAVCDPDNVASQGVLARCGFEAEGRLREDRLTADGWRDSLLYGWLPPGEDRL